MSAAQFADLHHQYVSLDVPHHVVFPFLHGVDGQNAAQNTFFRAPRTGQPTPNYRGLTVVRADMPTAEQASSMHVFERYSDRLASDGPLFDSRGRPRAFSSATSQSNTSSNDSDSSSGCDTDEERRRYMQATPLEINGAGHSDSNSGLSGRTGNRPRLMTASTSSSSIVSSNQSGPSIFSVSSGDYSVGSQTSVSSMSDQASESGKNTSRSSSAEHNRRLHSPDRVYEPQPSHSILNTTVFPREILVPPRYRRYSHGRCIYNEDPSSDEEIDAEWDRVGARFVVPAQAPGVSLRNFKIQCAKYATISDIVVYCPAGLHHGALTLAQWFREAQESMYDHRIARGLGGLRYNVFVVAEPFETFEHNYPELVGVDSHGFSRNRVDFVDREREEMQRLTAASEIDQNVWLGCTADAPTYTQDDSSDKGPLTPPDGIANPRGFAVCIEALDTAIEPSAMPAPARLAHASHFLDAHEATALFELDSRHALRKLTEDDAIQMDGFKSCFTSRDEANDDRGNALVLGPNGWTPRRYSCSPSSGFGDAAFTTNANVNGAKGTRIASQDQNVPLMPDAKHVVHLECGSTSPQYESLEHLDAVTDSILNLCRWIKQQACPSPDETKGSSQVPLTDSMRGVRYPSTLFSSSVQRDGRSQHATDASPSCTPSHRPRRVLLHCGDGYTETSIMALAYLMYSRELTLPEAYLDLQLRAERSFFVYARDVPLLKRIEERITSDRQSRQRQQALARGRNLDVQLARTRHTPTKSLGGRVEEFQEFSARPTLSRRSSASSSSDASVRATAGPTEQQTAWIRSLVAATGIASTGQQPSRGLTSSDRLSVPTSSRAQTPTPRERQRSLETGPLKSTTSDDRWFHDPRFEGSFPSRILPFLYLGNLNHAMNAHMLHALGITHVVSVGESALSPPKGVNSMYQLTESDKHNSLWHEYWSGRISVLDLKNVLDDGIDPLRDTMREAVEYIEAARRNGGKVLVHCRVGVSRSTTIVLAYVMAHLDLSLVESYLLVRSRRLNILIQPHLLFFWELRGWEAFLVQEKARRMGQKTSHYSSEASQALSTLSIRGCSGKSDCSGSFKSASSSPVVSPMSTACDMDWEEDNGLHSTFSHTQLDVDLAVGAGSAYGFEVKNAQQLPFGSGSPAGIPYSSLRLPWGHFAREISVLNSRYFV